MSEVPPAATTPAVAAPPAEAAKDAAKPGESAAPAPEAAKPEPTPQEKADAARWAAVTKKEKAILDAKKALDAEKATVAAEKAKAGEETAALRKELEAAKKANSPEAIKKALRLNPTKFLAEHGITLKDINEYELNGGTMNAEGIASLLDEREAKIRADIEAEKKAVAEATEKQRKDAEDAKSKAEAAALEKQKQQWMTTTVDMINSAVEKFPVITALGLASDVPHLIIKEYESTQRLLSEEEGAQQYESQLRGLMGKALDVPVIREMFAEKFQAKAAPASNGETKPAASDSAQPRAKTLTNDLTRSTPSGKPSTVNDAELLKRAEERMRAVRAKKSP